MEDIALKQTSTSLLLILAFGFLVPTTSMVAALTTDDSTHVSQLIAQGNEFSEKVFDNQKALEKYTEALALSPNDYEILWRLSRTYVDIGEHLPKNSWNGMKSRWTSLRKLSLPIRKEPWAIPGKQ